MSTPRSGSECLFSLMKLVECTANKWYWTLYQSFRDHRSCNVCIFCSAVGYCCCLSILESRLDTQTRVEWVSDPAMVWSSDCAEPATLMAAIAGMDIESS
jgi:hypothetical protein